MDSTAPFWSRPADATLAALAATREGLASADAATRLARHGPKSIAAGRGPSLFRLLLRQVESPLVPILVAGALLSAVLAEWVDAAIILIVVGGSALAGFFQEARAARAARAVEALRRRLALRVRPLRHGAPAEIPA